MVEAQVFQPENGPSVQAILFCPGFPGMGALLFEQRHAAALVQCGYDVIVIHHKGIRLDSPTAPAMVNNAARLMQGRQCGETHLGGGPAMIDEWLCEPMAALQDIDGRYESIHVIGNSFGALACLWSLTEPEAPGSNVKSIILLAGCQGLAEGGDADIVDRVWKPEFIAASRITDKVALNDPKAINATLRHVYEILPDRVAEKLRPDIALTYVVVEKDEFLTLADTKNFKAAIGGRGELVIDMVSRAWLDYGLIAHDTPDYKTEDFLMLIRNDHG
jgi:pimeloyl-ACP methyl ester carboxylesterase